MGRFVDNRHAIHVQKPHFALCPNPGTRLYLLDVITYDVTIDDAISLCHLHFDTYSVGSPGLVWFVVCLLFYAPATSKVTRTGAVLWLHIHGKFIVLPHWEINQTTGPVIQYPTVTLSWYFPNQSLSYSIIVKCQVATFCKSLIGLSWGLNSRPSTQESCPLTEDTTSVGLLGTCFLCIRLEWSRQAPQPPHWASGMCGHIPPEQPALK